MTQQLVCRTQPHPGEISRDAHRGCHFGHWYYHQAHPRLKEHPGFQAIEPLHKQMHDNACALLESIGGGESIGSEAFERFARSVRDLRVQIRALCDELTMLSHSIDPLTGVLNRTGMLTRLREDQEMVKRCVQPMTLIMIDLDDFKQVNDRYGHQTGDNLLRRVGDLLIEKTRAYDHVYRYGGEEFLVAMRNARVHEATPFSARLCEQIAAIRLEHSREVIGTTASIGLAEVEGTASITEFIRRADLAMYQAKRLGKNRHFCWSGELE
ncbi:MAG: hypothetical protein C3L25_11835 [Candidatus Sedimenticola endophacoides]|nr:MAG: hypothetical protein C3L26_11930 [Candidatus Sedimenticola endophacoides]PUE01776.1 MAG: hypothetical protein C3L25_11835 [Candidatus Sedimenticola endophacoides]